MARATDLPREAHAFLDAISIGESGGRDDDVAYSRLFGHDNYWLEGVGVVPQAKLVLPITTWPTDFPQWHGVWINGLPTHAFGRYQFEPRTWKGLGGGPCDPASQDRRAFQLAQQAVRGLLPSLQSGRTVGIGTRLTSTWTSVTDATFSKRYADCLAKIPQ